MANLIYYYGTMEAGKTTKLMQDYYNNKRHELKSVIVKPQTDTKGGQQIINRRGDSINVDLVLPTDGSFLSDDNWQKIKDSNFILVDEAQFLTPEQILELLLIAHKKDISVIAYGLCSNFQGSLFTGSSELFAKADQKYELTVTCFCGNIARFNARKVNGEFIYEGEEVVIDGAKQEVEYVPLCTDHYIEKVLLPAQKLGPSKRIKQLIK